VHHSDAYMHTVYVPIPASVAAQAIDRPVLIPYLEMHKHVQQGVRESLFLNASSRERTLQTVFLHAFLQMSTHSSGRVHTHEQRQYILQRRYTEMYTCSTVHVQAQRKYVSQRRHTVMSTCSTVHVHTGTNESLPPQRVGRL
jgi:hypothetical protein